MTKFKTVSIIQCFDLENDKFFKDGVYLVGLPTLEGLKLFIGKKNQTLICVTFMISDSETYIHWTRLLYVSTNIKPF